MKITVQKLALLCVFLISACLRADIIPHRLVDGHTADVLPRGYVDTELRVYSARDAYGSGLVMGMRVGITNRLSIGLSYGGEGLIGYGRNVRWYPYPGAMVKYRIFEEKFVSPAVTVGFDNQGYGGPVKEYSDDATDLETASVSREDFGYNGYLIKSPGIFLALSKNYILLNAVQLGFHGTLTYSLEEMDDVTWPNIVGGLDIGINDELMFVVEYDLAGNDITGRGNLNKYFLPHRGFLNMGLRWAFTESFQVQFDVKDILENKTRVNPLLGGREPVGWSRELKVVYVTKF